MAMLLNRVQFTKMVEEALNSGDLSNIWTAICSKREAIIIALRRKLPTATRRQYNNLQTLLKEQLDVVSEMMIGDAVATWKDEMRFYPQPDGTIICKCGNYEVMVADDFQASSMLVSTPLTRQARVKIIEAMMTGKVYAAKGPAGTGKTETIKDTMRILGMEAPVVNCSSDMKEAPMEAIDACKPHSGICPVIFDEFNCIPIASLEPVLKGVTTQTFACITMNPGYAGRTKLSESIRALCLEQEYTVPDFKLIVQVMLGAEGILDCDAIGAKVVSVISACKEKCSKAHWYDFGLRFIKTLVREIGRVGRKNGFDDETKLVVDCLGSLLYMRSTSEDNDIVADEIKKTLGVDAKIPAEFNSSTTEGVATMVEAVQQSRHGICIVGFPKDCDAIVVAINDAMKSESMIVEGDADSLCADDGPFTIAFKAAMKKTCPVNIIIKTPLNPSAWASLSSVLDDNKKLCLLNGEMLQMTPQMRVIIFEKDCSQYSPAAVSRCGMVYAAQSQPLTVQEKIVKLDFQGDMRRLRINISTSFVKDVQAKAFAAYGWDSAATVVMKYYDDEGDLCTLTNETVADAFALQASASAIALKLVVEVKL
jgi:dynein heavy chain